MSQQTSMFDLLPPPPQTAEEAEEAIDLKRHRLFHGPIKSRLIDSGLYGYPDLIMNPQGPFEEWKGKASTPKQHHECWPATYCIAYRGDSLTPSFRVFVREGQMENPAIALAKAVLGEFGDVEVNAPDSPTCQLCWHDRRRPRYPDEIVWGGM